MSHLTTAEIQNFMDGRLGAEESSSIRKHLQECENCTAELAMFRKAEAVLRSIPLLRAPAGFNELVLGQIRRLNQVKRKDPVLVPVIGGIFMVMLCVILTMLSIYFAGALNSAGSAPIVTNTANAITLKLRELIGPVGLPTFAFGSFLLAAISLYFLLDKYRRIKTL